jgi:hypothetical protein
LFDRKKLPNQYITIIKKSVRHAVMYGHNKITASFNRSCVIKLYSELLLRTSHKHIASGENYDHGGEKDFTVQTLPELEIEKLCSYMTGVKWID